MSILCTIYTGNKICFHITERKPVIRGLLIWKDRSVSKPGEPSAKQLQEGRDEAKGECVKQICSWKSGGGITTLREVVLENKDEVKKGTRKGGGFGFV